MTPHPEVELALVEARRRGELGVQVAAHLDGELVVDAWTGPARPEGGCPVDGDTLFAVFSVTKAVTATALHLQAARGHLDYAAPVAEYWPEFGCRGKEPTTVHHVLTHRAGIPYMPEGVTIDLMADWEWMVDHLAALAPIHEPGARSAYHSLTFGWLVGELVRRTDPAGRPLEVFVREEIAEPLRIEDLWLGLPPEQHDRLATLVAPTPAGVRRHEYAARAMPDAVAPDAAVHNDPRVIGACLPGAGLITTARSCSRFFAMLANGGELDGVRLLAEDHVRALTTPRERPDEEDLVLAGGPNAVPSISVGGFRLTDPVAGDTPGILCHPGAGGSIAWADLRTRTAAAICHNRLFTLAADDPQPFGPLGDALRRATDR